MDKNTKDYLKFRCCEMATKFEKNLPLFLKLLSNVKTNCCGPLENYEWVQEIKNGP